MMRLSGSLKLRCAEGLGSAFSAATSPTWSTSSSLFPAASAFFLAAASAFLRLGLDGLLRRAEAFEAALAAGELRSDLIASSVLTEGLVLGLIGGPNESAPSTVLGPREGEERVRRPA